MKKATVTYTAPPGEAKTVEIAGETLVSGKAGTVVCDDDLMKRLQNISMLKVEGVADANEPEPEYGKKHKEKAA